MLIVERKRKQKYAVGSGFVDTAMKFITTHKDTISNLADVAQNVAKTTAAAKQVYNVIKSRKADNKINKVLNDKSNDILKRLSENK